MFNEKKLAAFEFPAQLGANGVIALSHRVRLRLIWVIVLPLVFALAMFWLILIVNAGANLLPATTDVFAPYLALFPGQSADALGQYPCQMFDMYYGAPSQTRKFVCHLSPMGDIFQTIDVFASQSTITGVNFRVKHMRLVELVWQWGQPDRVYILGGKYRVQWTHDVNAVAKIGRRYSMQAPVDMIVMASQPSL